jgi:hypothetical protein
MDRHVTLHQGGGDRWTTPVRLRERDNRSHNRSGLASFAHPASGFIGEGWKSASSCPTVNEAGLNRASAPRSPLRGAIRDQGDWSQSCDLGAGLYRAADSTTARPITPAHRRSPTRVRCASRDRMARSYMSELLSSRGCLSCLRLWPRHNRTLARSSMGILKENERRPRSIRLLETLAA